MSVSEVHQALSRAGTADLYDEQRRSPKLRNLEEFIVHGLRYAFPCEPGAITRGIPTSFAAAPLRDHFFKQSTDLPPVWSDPEGSTRGYKIAPLYSSVPKAVKSDPELYQLLALVDAIREGRARERQMAQDLLHERFKST